MTLKDLTAFLAPNLELPWKDHVFSVAPPTKQDGLLLAALNATGISTYSAIMGACDTCGRSGDIEISDDQRALVAAAANRDLGEISLGGAYQEMVDAGVPAPDLDMFALYAFYYWTLGEKVADDILTAQHDVKRGVPAPKDRLPRQTTKSTGLASQSAQTKTARKSTQTTKSQKK